MQSYPQLITPQPIKPWMAFGSFLTIPNGGLLTSKPTWTWSLSLPHLTQTCLWFIWFWSFLLLLVLYDDDLNYIYKLYIYLSWLLFLLSSLSWCPTLRGSICSISTSNGGEDFVSSDVQDLLYTPVAEDGPEAGMTVTLFIYPLVI